MKITLEQIDLVRERCQATYQEANDALLETGGNVVEAIILLEQKAPQGAPEFGPKIERAGSELMDGLKDLVRKGTVTRIFLEKDGRTILDIPVLAGALGALAFAGATSVAIIAAIASGCDLKIVKQDGEVIDLRDVTDQAVQKVKIKVDELKTAHTSKTEESDTATKAPEEQETEVVVEEETK